VVGLKMGERAAGYALWLVLPPSQMRSGAATVKRGQRSWTAGKADPIPPSQ